MTAIIHLEMYFFITCGWKRVREKSEMTCVCSWSRVYSDRGNCHLMVLWFHGCLFPAFPYYHIWDAEYKSSPANTDLKSSNKDHNIKSASSMEPTDNKALRPEEKRAWLSVCVRWVPDGLLTEWVQLGSKC